MTINAVGIGQLSSSSMRRDYYRGSQDSLAIRGLFESTHFQFLNSFFHYHFYLVFLNFVWYMKRSKISYENPILVDFFWNFFFWNFDDYFPNLKMKLDSIELDLIELKFSCTQQISNTGQTVNIILCVLFCFY